MNAALGRPRRGRDKKLSVRVGAMREMCWTKYFMNVQPPYGQNRAPVSECEFRCEVTVTAAASPPIGAGVVFPRSFNWPQVPPPPPPPQKKSQKCFFFLPLLFCSLQSFDWMQIIKRRQRPFSDQTDRTRAEASGEQLRRAVNKTLVQFGQGIFFLKTSAVHISGERFLQMWRRIAIL